MHTLFPEPLQRFRVPEYKINKTNIINHHPCSTSTCIIVYVSTSVISFDSPGTIGESYYKSHNADEYDDQEQEPAHSSSHECW